MAAVTFYAVLWIEGGNDVIADKLQIPLYTITWIARVMVFVGPTVAFIVTRRICLGLQRKDKELLEHGLETGIIRQLPDGGFIEVHRPVDEEARAVLEAKKVPALLPAPGTEDENRVPASSRGAMGRLRARANRAFAETIVVETNGHGNGHRAGETGAQVVVGSAGEGRAAAGSASPARLAPGHSPGDDPPARSRATISASNARTVITSPGLPGRSSSVAHLPGMAPDLPAARKGPPISLREGD